MKVSIVIPVYNCEKYLHRSIYCVTKQTYGDIEIILVNNGSTDDSLQICKEYAAKDSRIVIIDICDNVGAGAARNAGIDAARGDYVIFLDADDWYEVSLVEKLLAAIESENSDVAICGYETYVEGVGDKNKEVFSLPTCVMNSADAVHKFFAESFPEGMTGFLWNKIYRISVIRDKNIRFPTTARLEDGFFNIDFFGQASSCGVISDVLYHYRISPQSDLARKYVSGYFETVEALTEYFIDARDMWGVSGVSLDNAYKFYINEFGSYLETAFSGAWNITDRELAELLDHVRSSKLYMESKRYLNTVGIYRRVLMFLFDNRKETILKLIIRVKVFAKKSLKPVFYFIRRKVV